VSLAELGTVVGISLGIVFESVVIVVDIFLFSS
jgi:hypothetical protein